MIKTQEGVCGRRAYVDEACCGENPYDGKGGFGDHRGDPYQGTNCNGGFEAVCGGQHYGGHVYSGLVAQVSPDKVDPSQKWLCASQLFGAKFSIFYISSIQRKYK